jgi:trehalose/maltose hydrolase-like predicted phosphorylase
VRNNAYTNRLVQWHLEKAVVVYEWLQETFPTQATELAQQLEITPVQILAFHSTIAQMYIPYNPKTLLIEQFEGFFALQDLNLSDYEPRTRSIGIGPITRVGAADIVLPNLIGVNLVDLQTQLKLAPAKTIQPTV